MGSFRTIVKISSSPYKLSYFTPSVFIGSCFTESIGGKLNDYKFPVDINPFGIIYNPSSVGKSIELLIGRKEFTKENLFFFEKKWISFYHHSSFSDKDPELCLKRINRKIAESGDFLKKSEFLFLTFGTAWVYQWKESGEIVSNCHKIPASRFNRKLLTTVDILENYQTLINKLLKFNPRLKIVFTISPVRHWKDSPEGNQVSKSVLLLSVHQLTQKFQSVGYFPAYEIMMDDLRDYRFYAEDMIHLNSVAVDYIWERFKETYLDKEALSIMQNINPILSAMGHRPFDADSERHQDFVQKILDKTKKLQSQYSFIDFRREIKHFETGLKR
jgi:hypothetical protein